MPTSAFPGSPSILKGGFLLHPAPGTPPTIVVFPYNPENLCRTVAPSPDPAAVDPVQTIVFTLVLDATDQLEAGSAAAAATGVYPVLSAIELLMYPQSQAPGSTLLFAWGPDRLVPVRITALRILEELFDPNLSPIQARVEVTLTVSGQAAVKDGPDYLGDYVANLNALAGPAYTRSVAPLGIAIS